MSKKIIYLSMETKIREYHAKLLFTLYALQRGYQVVFGSKYAMNKPLQLMPEGIYIGTGVTEALGADLLKAQSFGHRAVSFDEEGLAYFNLDVFMNTRIREDIIRKISQFFTWGHHHSEIVYKKAPDLVNISDVGNMRFELLKTKYHRLYSSTVQSLRQKYGDYILINTNLKVFNHITGQERLFESMRNTTVISNSNDEIYYKDRYAHQKETFESYCSLVKSITSHMKDLKIVIRPHTSENKETWKALDMPNVVVENYGNVIPWILASKAVIQKNCTTSTETVCLNRPVITYSVTHDPRFDSEMTKSIGKFCENEAEVLDVLGNSDSFDEQIQADREFLSEYVSNMGEDENTAYAILDILDGIDVPEFYDNADTIYRQSLFESSLRTLGRNTVNLVKKNTQERKLVAQKFPGLKKSELTGDIQTLAETISIPIKNIQTTEICKDLYHLTLK